MSHSIPFSVKLDVFEGTMPGMRLAGVCPPRAASVATAAFICRKTRESYGTIQDFRL